MKWRAVDGSSFAKVKVGNKMGDDVSRLFQLIRFDILSRLWVHQGRRGALWDITIGIVTMITIIIMIIIMVAGGSKL